MVISLESVIGSPENIHLLLIGFSVHLVYHVLVLHVLRLRLSLRLQVRPIAGHVSKAVSLSSLLHPLLLSQGFLLIPILAKIILLNTIV